MTQQPRAYSAKSIRFSSVFVLKLSDFLKLAEEYPSEKVTNNLVLNLKEMYHMIKDRINLQKEYTLLSSKCQLCQGINHNLFSCPLLFPQKDVQAIIDAYLKDFDDFRADYIRSVKRTPNALANFKVNQEKGLLIRKAYAQLPTPKSVLLKDEPEENSDNTRKIIRKFQQMEMKKMKSDLSQSEPKNHPLKAFIALGMKTSILEDKKVAQQDLQEIASTPINQDKIEDSPVSLSSLLVIPTSLNEIEEQPEPKKVASTLGVIEEVKDENADASAKPLPPLLKPERSVSSDKTHSYNLDKVYTPHFLLRLPPRFIEDDFVFETVKNYEIYMPQNNVWKVAYDIKAKAEKRRKLDIALNTPNEINLFKLKLGRIMSKLKKGNRSKLSESMNNLFAGSMAGVPPSMKSLNYLTGE